MYVAESENMWQYRTEYITNAKTQLREIDGRLNEARASLSKPLEFDVVSRAEIYAEIMPREAARQAFEDVLEHYPENAAALYYTGYDAYQYDYDLVTAEDRLARAIESDPRLEFDVSNFMVAIYRELEKPDEAAQWHQHGFGACDALQDSWDERASVTFKDKLIPGTLTNEQSKERIESLKGSSRSLSLLFGSILIARKRLARVGRPEARRGGDGASSAGGNCRHLWAKAYLLIRRSC